MSKSYIVCSIKPWNAAAFRRKTPALPGQWHFIEDPSLLTVETLAQFAPRYVFFPHWSWRVPNDILTAYECVCFHMSDVPYGRGGSPLQNLIMRGHTTTMLTALRMIELLDAGPVYLKRPLSLDGRAEEIFTRAADLTYDLVAEIITKELTPTASPAMRWCLHAARRRKAGFRTMPPGRRFTISSACWIRRRIRRHSSNGENYAWSSIARSLWMPTRSKRA